MRLARLLVYLLLKGKMTASPREIASAIWPGEDIEATVKNIKGLVYRFRQTFELLSDHRLIESTPTGYQINPQLNVYVVSWCVGHLVELAQPEAYDVKYSKPLRPHFEAGKYVDSEYQR